MDRITIFACESQPIVVEGLQKALAACEDLEFVGAVPTVSDALESVRSLHPDLVLVDQFAGVKTVFQFISDVRNTSSGCHPILWVTDLAEVDCFRALQLGARGIIRKTLPVETLQECLRSVGRGNVWVENSLPEPTLATERRSASRLTPREKEIVHHVCTGMKNKEIAGALSITAGTVKVHLMHIFEKTGVRDRFELAVHGRRLLGAEHAQHAELAQQKFRAENVGA